MASIETRSRADGSTAYRVKFRIDGHQDSETFDTEDDAKEFVALCREIGPEAAVRVRDARDGQETTAPTLREWFAHYQTHYRTGVTDGTVAEDERVAERSWLRDLGSLPLDVIDRDAIARWINRQKNVITRLGGPTSAKSLANMHGLLSQVLQAAAEDDDIPLGKNVAKGIALPNGQVEEMVFLTHDEFARVFTHILPHWRPLIVTLAGTGMRWGEATALQWGEVTLDGTKPTIRVMRAWKKGKTQRVMGIPKTKKSRRSISLPQEVVDVLLPLSEDKKSANLVFTGPRSGYVHHQSFRRVWHNAVARSGIDKQPRVHDLRHSHVAWLAATGTVQIQDIQARLGHESITTTWDRYGHLFDDAAVKTAAAASMALSQALPEVLALTE